MGAVVYRPGKQRRHAEGPPLRPNRSLEQGLGLPDGGFPAGQFRLRICLQRWLPFGVDKLEYAAGSCAMPLQRRQLLPDEPIFLFGLRDDMMRGVGDQRLPTGLQFICSDQAFEGVLIWRPAEHIAALTVDLYGHYDAENKLVDEGGHEQAGYLRLTCCDSSLDIFRNSRLWQGLAEGHPRIDELPHVAIDEHDVAALTQGQRGLGLALELSEVASAPQPSPGTRRWPSERLQGVGSRSVIVGRRSTI